MLTIMGIILGFIILFILIVKYIEYKYNENQKKKFEKNFKKFKTRTGALSNDRIYERTTIPKRNGKRNT